MTLHNNVSWPFLTACCPSTLPVTLKAQQEPHMPWQKCTVRHFTVLHCMYCTEPHIPWPPLHWALQHSIHTPLLRRGLYKALSHWFCACSGVLKITLYCVQKLGTVQQTADSCTPSDSQAHSQGQQKLLRGNWAPSFGLCSGHSGDVFPTSLDPKDLSLFVWMSQPCILSHLSLGHNRGAWSVIRRDQTK